MQSSNKTIDKWLGSLGYYRKLLAHDETCFFRAVSEQIFNTQLDHEKIRFECANYVEMNKYKFRYLLPNLNDYIEDLRNHHVSCGEVEMKILSAKYKYDFIIFDSEKFQIRNMTNNLCPKQIYLCLVGNDHFDNVYKKEYIDNSGFCQSIVYNVLYANVFKFENVEDIVEKMLHKKPDENDDDLKQFILEKTKSKNPQNIILPFPYKVAKALDPKIYRNIAFDTWSEFRREWRLKNWYQGDQNFKVGTRCLLNLRYRGEYRKFHCYIQKMDAKNGPINVYVEELAEFKNVKYDQLEIEPNGKPWTLPYRYLKNKDVKNGDNSKEIVPYKKGPNKKEKENKDSSSGNQKQKSMSTSSQRKNDSSYFEGCALSKIDPNIPRQNPELEWTFNNLEQPLVPINHIFEPHTYNVTEDLKPYMTNVDEDFNKLYISQSYNEFLSSQCNAGDQNNNFTYFTQVTTEMSYATANQTTGVINWESPYSMCPTTNYCQYPYVCPCPPESIPMPYYSPPIGPPPTPMWTLSPPYDDMNYFAFPPPVYMGENSYGP